MEWWKGWPSRGGAFPLRSAWGMGLERKTRSVQDKGAIGREEREE
jgi:hypothetical protein